MKTIPSKCVLINLLFAEGDEAEGANSDKTILKHNDVIHTSVDEVVVKDFVSDESSCRCDVSWCLSSLFIVTNT